MYMYLLHTIIKSTVTADSVCLISNQSFTDSLTRKFSSRKRIFPFVRPNRLSLRSRKVFCRRSIDHLLILKKGADCFLCKTNHRIEKLLSNDQHVKYRDVFNRNEIVFIGNVLNNCFCSCSNIIYDRPKQYLLNLI